jgi:hypothetical protein
VIDLGHCLFIRALIDWFTARQWLEYREARQLRESVKGWEQRIASCMQKHPFATFTAASKVAQRNRNDPHKTYDAYQCRVCQKYHVGTARKSTRTLRLNYRKRKNLAHA